MIYTLKRKGQRAPSVNFSQRDGKNHVHHHDNHQQTQPEDFCDEQFPPDYQEEPPNQPKVDLYELDQRDTPDHRHNHNICDDHHHLDHEVS